MNTILFYPTETDTDIRLDQFLAIHLTNCTRTRAQALIESGAVHINNYPSTKSNKTIRNGDIITVLIPEKIGRDPEIGNFAHFFAENLLFEHEHFLIINKPAGITVHAPSDRSEETTVADLAVAYCPAISTVGEATRPGIVHRLDKLTSGLLIIAKTTAGYMAFRELFATRTIKKTYLAIVAGKPPAQGTINCPIIRDPFDPRHMACADNTGRPACTIYNVITYYRDYALIAAHPVTGRTHQIRVHMAHAGYPVVGDQIYGNKKQPIDRYALHAAQLNFTFMGQDFVFEAPLPEELVEFLKKCDPANNTD